MIYQRSEQEEHLDTLNRILSGMGIRGVLDHDDPIHHHNIDEVKFWKGVGA